MGYLSILTIISCQDEPIKLDYCEMIKLDQSYVNTDKSNSSKFKSDKEKRSKLIKKNFELLIKKTLEKDFSNYNLDLQNLENNMEQVLCPWEAQLYRKNSSL